MQYRKELYSWLTFASLPVCWGLPLSHTKACRRLRSTEEKASPRNWKGWLASSETQLKFVAQVFPLLKCSHVYRNIFPALCFFGEKFGEVHTVCESDYTLWMICLLHHSAVNFTLEYQVKSLHLKDGKQRISKFPESLD